MAVDSSKRLRMLGGASVKHITMAALVLQNAALVLLMHYSRTMPLVGGERYYASTAVFLSEVVKFSFFLSMALYEIATSPQTPDTSTVGELSNALSKAVFTGDSWKLAAPAILYTLQNSLQYVAASNLSATTFSVTYQLKLLTASIFGAIILGRHLSLRKWMSLALLVFGVLIVSMSTVSQQGRILSIADLKDGVSFHSPRSIWDMEAEGNEAAGQLNKRSATYEGIDDDFAAANPHLDTTIGVAAAAVACVLSGSAGSYFEKLLKHKGDFAASVWVRNVQLSFYTLWPALFVGVFFMDGEYLSKTGFFTGYNWIVWVVIFLQAIGGVLVAVALDHMDSTAKALSTSISTAIVFLASTLFLEFRTTVFYLVGTATTLVAAYLYSSSSGEQNLRPPPISISQYEKNDEPGYFDIASVSTAGKSPLRDHAKEALSTSRPSTPISERRPLRSKSTERLAKREE